MPVVMHRVTVKRCRKIIGNARCWYWAKDYRLSWNQRKCVVTLRRPAGGGEFDIRPKRSKVDATDICAALERMLAGKATHAGMAGVARQAATSVLDGTDGGGDCDSVLQVAFFNGIVYG